MSLVRASIERLFAVVFGLIGVLTVFPGLSVLGALVVTFVTIGHSAPAPVWLSAAMIRGAAIGALLAAGGVTLGAIRARWIARLTHANGIDDSAPREWVGPASLPTLLFPAVALWLSQKLLLLCNDIVAALVRLGVPDLFTRGAGSGGWVLLPIFAALFVPFLEVMAALSLVALPPLLLVLLITRSQRFRMNCQLVLVAQATFVGASLIGADLFGRLADQARPLIQTAEGPEAAIILAALARGREVLIGTAMAHGAMLALYAASLWVSMSGRVSRGESLMAADPPLAGPAQGALPAFEMPSHPALTHATEAPTPEAGAARPSFDEVLARVRARRVAAAGGAAPAGAVMAPRSLRSTGRALLVVVLMGWGGTLVVFGACQLATPHTRYVGSTPGAGARLEAPPATIVVRFNQALDPASTVSVQRTSGLDGASDAGATPLSGAAVLDPGDPAHRTLRADVPPTLSGGIYRVDWRVVTAIRQEASYGGFYFGIGLPVPSHLASPADKPFRGRDARTRGYRAALLGGLVFLALAAFVSWQRLAGSSPPR